MENPKDHMIAWLNDAYSMERALIPTLENHAKDAKGYPQIADRIQEHIAETKRHSEMVESCLRRYNEEPSTVKNVLGSLFGNMQSIATGMYDDELVKNALMDFAAENFEIACYQALMVAAEDLGDTDTAQICRQIIEDEERMARFLSDNLPTVVRETLHAVT